MKNTLTIITLAIVLVLSATLAHAQRRLVYSTISANQNATQTTLNVTSSTGAVVGQFVVIGAEVEKIVSLNGIAGTSTVLTVQRGVEGVQSAHDNTNPLFYTGNATDIKHSDPDYQQDCALGVAQAAVLPWYNVLTATKWQCNVPRWVGNRAQNIQQNSDPATNP